MPAVKRDYGGEQEEMLVSCLLLGNKVGRAETKIRKTQTGLLGAKLPPELVSQIAAAVQVERDDVEFLRVVIFVNTPQINLK